MSEHNRTWKGLKRYLSLKCKWWKRFQWQWKKLWVLVPVKMHALRETFLNKEVTRVKKQLKLWFRLEDVQNCCPQQAVIVTARTHRRKDSLEKTPANSSYSIFWVRGEGGGGLNDTKLNRRESKKNYVMQATSLCKCPGRGARASVAKHLRDLQSMRSRERIQVVTWQPSFISEMKRGRGFFFSLQCMRE